MCVITDGIWIGGMDLLTTYNTPLGTTSTYHVIANLHNSQITTAPAKTSSSLLCLHQPLPGNGF
jgi:hypothetical protein